MPVFPTLTDEQQQGVCLRPCVDLSDFPAVSLSSSPSLSSCATGNLSFRADDESRIPKQNRWVFLGRMCHWFACRVSGRQQFFCIARAERFSFFPLPLFQRRKEGAKNDVWFYVFANLIDFQVIYSMSILRNKVSRKTTTGVCNPSCIPPKQPCLRLSSPPVSPIPTTPYTSVTKFLSPPGLCPSYGLVMHP